MVIDDWKNNKVEWKTTGSKTAVLYPALDALIEPEGKRILDVGCGDGYGVRHYTNQGARVVGVDLSTLHVATCKQADPEGDYRVADARDLQINEQFDYVLSLLVLLSFGKKTEITAAIAQMKDCLAPGGKVLIATVHPAFDIVNESMGTMTRAPIGEYAYGIGGTQVRYTHNSKPLVLNDFHWKIEDYVECIKEAGMLIEDIKEPLPVEKSRKENEALYLARCRYLPFIIFSCVPAREALK